MGIGLLLISLVVVTLLAGFIWAHGWLGVIGVVLALMFLLGVLLIASEADAVPSKPEPEWYTQQIRITEQWTPETGWQEVARDTLFYEGCIGDWVNIEEVR